MLNLFWIVVVLCGQVCNVVFLIQLLLGEDWLGAFDMTENSSFGWFYWILLKKKISCVLNNHTYLYVAHWTYFLYSKFNMTWCFISVSDLNDHNFELVFNCICFMHMQFFSITSEQCLCTAGYCQLMINETEYILGQHAF